VAATVVRTRPARPGDAADILQLLADAKRDTPLAAIVDLPTRPEPLATALATIGSEAAVIVAEEGMGGDLVGVLFAARGPGPTRHTASLSVAVDVRRRRQGAGRALVRAAVLWAGEVGVERLTASVASANGASLSLFGGLGFAVEGRRPSHLCIESVLYDEVLFGLSLSLRRPAPPAREVRR
jgi:phosphinothricin acetyltransferase